MNRDELRVRRDRLRERLGVLPAELEALHGTEAELTAALAAFEREHAAQMSTVLAGMLRASALPITAEDERTIARGELEHTRAVAVVAAWWSSSAPLLVLSGPPGVGKSIAAIALCAREAAWGHGARYIRARKLAELYEALYGDAVRERERVVASHLLVVDDVGAERRTEAMAEALLEVLDVRRRGQRTIWATNLSRAAVLERYPDPRLHSRLAQAARWSTIAGDDMRRPGDA